MAIQIEDVNSQSQLSATQQLSQGNTAAPPAKAAAPENDDDDDMPPLEGADVEDENLDETGLDPKEIDLVMQQVNCSRAKAVRVLKDNGGDIINASKFSSLQTVRICHSNNKMFPVMAASD